MTKFTLQLMVMVIVTACGVEPMKPDERLDESSFRDPCSRSKTHGCLYGQVAAAPGLVVNKREFFDASDFSAQVHEVLPAVTTKDGEAFDKQGESLSWSSSLTNENFTDGFTAYVKGEEAHQIPVRRDGFFSLDHLQPGYYELRVQRSLELTLVRKSSVQLAADPEAEKGGNDDDAAPSTEVPATPTTTETKFCAILYTEEAIEIDAKKRYNAGVYDRFTLEVQQCTSERSSRENTLQI